MPSGGIIIDSVIRTKRIWKVFRTHSTVKMKHREEGKNSVLSQTLSLVPSCTQINSQSIKVIRTMYCHLLAGKKKKRERMENEGDFYTALLCCYAHGKLNKMFWVLPDVESEPTKSTWSPTQDSSIRWFPSHHSEGSDFRKASCSFGRQPSWAGQLWKSNGGISHWIATLAPGKLTLH